MELTNFNNFLKAIDPVKTGPGKAITDPSIGGILSGLFNIILFIAAFLMFFWMAWGVFQYIFSGGNKERVGKARSRITWAIVGFIIIVLAFTLKQFIQGFVPFREDQPITTITRP